MENVTKIIGQLADAGVEVYLTEDKLKARSLKGGLAPELLSLIKLNKPEIIEYLSSQSETKASNRRPEIIPLKRKSEIITPSYAQQRLWFIDQMEGGSAHYNMPSAMRLTGDFKVVVAQSVFAEIIQRHEILRTVFVDSDEGPMQVIQEDFKFSIQQTDLSHLTAAELDAAIKSAIEHDAHKLFDLNQDLMLRVGYLLINDESGVLLFNMHHIASDGWSIGIMIDEFVKRYTAKLTGETLEWTPLAIQYADYAHQQRQWLTGEVLEKQLNYWDQKLADLPSIHHLPLDYERPQVQTFNGATDSFELNQPTMTQLKQIGLDNQATLFMVLHAAFSVLIARYSNLNDVVIGTPVANRLQQELEPLIGFFVNTLVLRADCSGDPSFIDLLKQIKQTNIDAQSNQDVPFEHLVDRLNPDRSTSHNALFQIMLTMNTNEHFDLLLPGVHVDAVKQSEEVTAKFDLVLKAFPTETEEGAELHCIFEYNADLFSAQTIKRLSNSMVRLLTGIAVNPSRPIADLPLISAEETDYLLNTLNTTQMDYPDHLNLHQLFEQQVKRTPNHVAVVYENQSLTYATLNQRANQLAYHLIKQGVKADEVIGLCFDRSLDMVVAIIGILKSGAAYLPLDPSHPKGRLAYMMQDAGLSKIITQQHLSTLTSGQDIQQLVFDAAYLFNVLNNYATINPEVNHVTSKNLAYVIYTSGSTGMPKGVMIEHRQAVHSVCARKQYYQQAVESFLLISPVAFDSSVAGIMWTLLSGGQLIIAKKESITDPEVLLSLIDQHQVSHTLMTPALYSVLLGVVEAAPIESLQVVIVAGESVPHSLPQRHHQLLPKTHLFNEYGPTEGSVWSTATELLPDAGQNTISIGRAINNVQLYVLDEHQCLLPMGAVGELYIGGEGLARGYLGQPSLTAEKFSMHQFNRNITQRLYQTGDLVRYLDSGELAFVGRVDQQLKIRGYRIELGEIEHQLAEHPAVDSSVIIARQVADEAIQLVAYFTSHSNAKEAALINEIKSTLQHHLPEYMMPSVFMLLPSMPLNANGKIDRKALPEPDVTAQQTAYVAPDGETQIQLASIWAKLLKIPVENISAHANFFSLGGHSLLSIRLLADVRKIFDCELSVRHIFDKPKLAEFAYQITCAEKGGRPLIKKMQRKHKHLMPSFAQQRLWFIDKMDGGSAHYNIPSAMRIDGGFRLDIANEAIQEIIERHETLRTVFIEINDEPMQVVLDNFNFTINEIELKHQSTAMRNQFIETATIKDANQSFDLSKDLMLRVSYFHCHDQAGVLLFNVHHIAADGWSVGVLIDEFVKRYSAKLNGSTHNFEALDIQYADYANWQRNWLKGEALKQQLHYWDEQLRDLPQVHSLPLDFKRPQFQTFQGALHTFNIKPTVLAQLEQLADDNQATLFMVIHAAFSILIAKYSNNSDVVIGTPVANRIQKEVEPLIGFFVNTLVLRTNCSNDLSFNDFLSQIKNVNLDAQVNQDVPFEHLVDRLKPNRTTSHNALFQIMLTMDNNEVFDLILPGVKLSPMSSDRVSAKFDLMVNLFTSNGLEVCFQYSTDIFSEKTIERMANSFKQLLTNIVAKPLNNISKLSLMNEQEMQYLLHGLNQNKTTFPDLCIHQLFENQVALTPNGMALGFGDIALTYQELNAQANQVANYLIEQKVSIGDVVGLCTNRSITMIIGLLAILKTGATYLPIDPTTPTGRLDHMIRETKLQWVITQDVLREFTKGQNQLCLDTVETQHILKTQPTGNPHLKELTSGHLAYVIFTSGSTGLPKGVLQTHQTIVNLVCAQAEQGGLDSPARTLQFAPINFDVSIQELATSWFTNSPLILITQQAKDDLHKLPEIIDQLGIERMFLPPAVLNWLAEMWSHNNQLLGRVKEIIVAGEALVVSADLDNFLAAHGDCKLWNHYGPTETHVATIARVDGNHNLTSQPIGQVIHNMSAYVLDHKMQLLPFGAIGELCVAGTGVAKGYLNQNELSEDRFVQNPYINNEIIYRTGDLVRYMENGSLEFIGRLDAQIQIRGFRIEPGEIEFHLSRLAFINRAVVDVQLDDNKEALLVAFFTTDSNQDQIDLINEIRCQIKHDLPHYMIPSVFILIDEFPLTLNGKIDRKNLPTPLAFNPTQFVAPESKTELQLADIWANLLKIPHDTISQHAHFFEMGGHSLLTVRLLAEIRTAFKCEVSVRDVFEAPQLALLAEKINNAKQSNRPAVTAIDRKTHPLKPSFAQQRLWFIDQMDKGNSHYNLPFALRLTGQFNLPVAQTAFKQIINRHEILRTVFKDVSNGPLQVIKNDFQFEINEVNLAHLSAAEQPASIHLAIESFSGKPFDLTEDLMLRVSYLRLSDTVAVLLLNMHHIASDGWSVGVLTEEFVTLYRSGLAGSKNPLEPLQIQYADYAHWQRNWLQGEALEQQLLYWDHQLAELSQVHRIPLDYERPQYQTFNGASHPFKLDQQITEKLETIALDNQVTLFMLIHAVFSVFIYRYSNHEDVVIGTPVANRMQKELQPLIGFFVNTMVLRANCSGNPRFIEFLDQVKNINMDAQANQDVPFEYLVDRLNPARNPSHQALFQIMLSMNTNEYFDLNLPNVVIKPELTSHRVSAKFDLTLMAIVKDRQDTVEGINFSFEYNTDLFSADSIGRFADSMIRLFTCVANTPTKRIGELALISDAETDLLLYRLNENATPYPRHLCVHQLFEQQVEKTPELQAVLFENQSLSYYELNRRANQLAHFLIEQGIKLGNKVGLCFDRSLDFVTAQLAVFKSGGTYVPLDPSQPKARLECMIQDSDLSLILTQSRLANLTIDPQKKSFIVDQDDFISSLSHQPHSNPFIENLTPDSLAYIIYSSGSTGIPKGSLNTHLGLNNLSNWHVKQFNVNTDKVGSHLTSIGFDAAVWEIWPYLIVGAKVLLISDHIKVSPQELVQHLNQHHVTHSFLPTALLDSAYDHFDSAENTTLEYIFAGGEKLNKHGFVHCKTRLINIYGPSESSVVTTFHEVKAELQGKSPPIGKAVDNIKTYVLNSQRSLVPFKTTAELYIAGDGLAKGYQNQAKLSSEKFIRHTFCDGHTEDLYQTGDLVRYIEGGLLDFVARVDNQIKIRGFRVELGEVEFHLSELPQVDRSVVLIEKDQYGNKQLSAYLVLNTKFKDHRWIDEQIRSGLKAFIPAHMVPSYLTILDDFPLTPNGKVDNKKLTDMPKLVNTTTYISPVSELEKTLVNVLAKELKLVPKNISMGANFFDIGGHSLALLNVINQMSQHDFYVNLKLFYECESLQEICHKHCLSDSTVSAEVLIKLNSATKGPPLYLFHPMGGRADCYKQLATMLEPQVPVVGVQAPFVSNQDFNFEDLSELAGLYAQAIFDHQPKGPYRLGGWSVGGLLAQKVVEVLNKAGKEVEYFVGIDCFMEMPFMQKNDRFEALHETVAFIRKNTAKEVKDSLDEVADQNFEQQLAVVAQTIIQEDDSGISEDYLIRGLRFGVDIFKAKISQSKQTISKQATLFIAEQNDDKNLLLQGWHNAFDANTLQKEIEGEHLYVLEGKSLGQLADQISVDIIGMNKP